jgi:HK97 family phage portal protein
MDKAETLSTFASGQPQQISTAKTELYSTFSGGTPQQITTSDGRTFNYNGKSGETALSVASFYSGTRFIAETLSTLPKNVYKKTPKGREKLDHAITPLLTDYPNETINAVYLWETAIGHAVMYGNGYVFIERQGGRVVALHNIHATRVYPTRVGRQLVYGVYMGEGKKPEVLTTNDLIHIRNFSEDGDKGISVIDTLCDTLGMPRKLDQFIDKFFENGSAINLVVEASGKLDKADVDTLRYGIDQNHKGLDNAHKAMILSGATAKNLTLPLKDMALDVLKAATIDDIARVLRIPPTTLYALGRATWGNLEQLGTELVKYSFTSWVVKIELECKRKLLTPQERSDGLYIKWNLDGLQRGDYSTRVTSGVSLVNNRMLTPNEWREREDLEPYEGGDSFYGPLNTPKVEDSTEPMPAITADPTAETVSTPMATANASVPTAPLNGAQITAAVEVIVQLKANVLTPEAATALLQAVGIDPTQTASMVSSTVAAGPLQTVTETTPTPAAALPPAEANAQGYKKQYGKILEDAAARVKAKQTKAFANAESKTPEQYATWLPKFAESQGMYLAESLNPILESFITDPTDLSFALQNCVEKYSALVLDEKESADPSQVVNQILERYNEKN